MTRSKDTVRITTDTKPVTAGKALLIRAPTNITYPDSIPIYLPLSTVHEIHDTYIVCDKWIAYKKDLANVSQY